MATNAPGPRRLLSSLDMNDVEVNAPEHDLELLVLDVAQGIAGKKEVADFFRQLSP